MAVEELSLTEAWDALQTDSSAVLIDVRTTAEWAYVGTADLSAVGREPRLVEWIRFPDGAPNPDFLAQATNGLDPEQRILLLCRSGARSRAAGELLQANGFTQAANVTAGFEGDLDGHGHRHNGWKDHLPWRQT